MGIDSIDGQHKKLVDLINELYTQMNFGSAKEAVGSTLGKLIDYTGDHFQYEEEIFAKHDYPEQKQHQAVYTKLVASPGA